MSVSDVESFEFEYLDIANTSTIGGCSIVTGDGSITRILLYPPAEIGPLFGSLVDEIELSTDPVNTSGTSPVSRSSSSHRILPLASISSSPRSSSALPL